MSTRHIARSVALQVMFEIDQREAFDMPTSLVLDIIKRDILEFAPQVKDASFIKTLVEETIARRITLDDIIVRAAPDWPIDKISAIDRNILRLGLYELLFGDRSQVPPKVAIDEAIELAKTYGGETSGKFVNGVLGAIYKELGEPGKADTSKSKAPAKREDLYGAVVVGLFDDIFHVALIHDKFGYWTLPKGHHRDQGITGDESLTKTVLDEVGAEVSVHDKLGEHEYIANNPEKGKVAKHVIYKLCIAKHKKLQKVTKEGITDVKWYANDEWENLRMYDDVRPLLRSALALVKEASVV